MLGAVTIDTKTRILAWIHVIGSGLVLVVGCILVIASALDPRYVKTALPFYFGLFFWLGVALLFPSFAGGIGLLRRANWGKILIVIVSVEVLFVVPVGTALGVFGLWTLLGSGSKFVPAVQMPALAAAPAVVRQRYDILLAMAYVASGFLLLLGGGFLIWGEAETRSRLTPC